MLTHLLWLLMLCDLALSSKDFTIIGLFKADEILAQNAFNFAVQEANTTIDIQLKPKMINYTSTNESSTMQEVCETLAEKPVAVFGPKSDHVGSRIHMLATLKGLPFFRTDMSYEQYDDALTVYPPPETVGAVIASLIQHRQWETFFILYENQEQLQDALIRESDERKIFFRKFPADGNYAGLIRDMEEVHKPSRVVIHAGLETTKQFLIQLKEVNSTTEFDFTFTNLDVHTLNLKHYCQRCSMFGITLMQHNKQMNRLSKHLQKLGPENFFIPTVAAVIYDSVMLLAKTLEAVHFEAESLSCQLEETWLGGSELSKEIKSAEYRGATGTIAFDSNGQRNASSFSIVNLTESGFQQLGTWNEKNGLQLWNQTTSHVQQTSEEEKQPNLHLRVAVILSDPFMMLKNSTENSMIGDHPYEGYCIDLLEQIASIAKFNYTIHNVSDGYYGVKHNGTWNGFVNELMQNETDLVMADFTINSERSEVISFSNSFMDVGLALVYKRPREKHFDPFTIFAPLSGKVWIGLIGAYILVSYTLLVLGHLSPYEWYNFDGGSMNSEIARKNKLNLSNSFWFTLGSLMLQGSDVAPRAPSTRLVAGFWWMFVMIITASYTANLASFLTVKLMDSPIGSINDLVKQKKIFYGILNNSAQMQFFAETKIPVYEKIWSFMQNHPSVFVQTDQEGLLRVKEQDYAYLTESTGINYIIERNCDLMQIGDLIYAKGYGIGLQKSKHCVLFCEISARKMHIGPSSDYRLTCDYDSPYKDSINKAIEQLKDSNALNDLRLKWLKNSPGEGCQEEPDSNALGISNVSGAFVFLVCGLVLGCLVLILEYIHKFMKVRAAKVGQRAPNEMNINMSTMEKNDY